MVTYTGAGNRTNVRLNGENIAPYTGIVYFVQKQTDSNRLNRDRLAGSARELPSERCMTVYIDMEKIHDNYILIDCMPSLGMIAINALVAADSVLIPVQAHYLPAKGMTQLLQTIRKVQHINPNLSILGL